jgi:hypothetical protein
MNPTDRMPWWVKAVGVIGVPTFLCLYILGAFDGVLASPLTTALKRHDESNQKTLRLICRGTWRGDEVAQRECD